MSQYNQSNKSRVRRSPKRASYEKNAIHQILDRNLVAHIAFIDNGQPFVIPMLYGRKKDQLYLHGASSSRLLKILGKGSCISLSVANVDGLVLTRSAYHHTLNYRSVVIFGEAILIEDMNKKKDALKVIFDHMLPGRWEEVRPPSENELKATGVLSIVIEEASAKIRDEGPVDEKKDYELPVWAGVVPISEQYESPIRDDSGISDLPLPESLKGIR